MTRTLLLLLLVTCLAGCRSYRYVSQEGASFEVSMFLSDTHIGEVSAAKTADGVTFTLSDLTMEQQAVDLARAVLSGMDTPGP